MANGKNSIIVYRDWIDIFDDLTDEEAGKLIKHFFRYVNDLNPEVPDRLTGLMFKQIKSTLKRDLKKWEEKSEKNRENARLRWDKNNANACERKKRNAKNADSDSVSDSVSDNDIKNKIIYNSFYDSEIEKSINEPLIEKYQSFVKFIYGNNPTGEPLKNCLKLDQVKYKSFEKLIEKSKESGKPILDTLLSLENKKDAKYKSLTLTLNNWLK